MTIQEIYFMNGSHAMKQFRIVWWGRGGKEKNVAPWSKDYKAQQAYVKLMNNISKQWHYELEETEIIK